MKTYPPAPLWGHQAVGDRCNQLVIANPQVLKLTVLVDCSAGLWFWLTVDCSAGLWLLAVTPPVVPPYGQKTDIAAHAPPDYLPSRCRPVAIVVAQSTLITSRPVAVPLPLLLLNLPRFLLAKTWQKPSKNSAKT